MKKRGSGRVFSWLVSVSLLAAACGGSPGGKGGGDGDGDVGDGDGDVGDGDGDVGDGDGDVGDGDGDVGDGDGDVGDGDGDVGDGDGDVGDGDGDVGTGGAAMGGAGPGTGGTGATGTGGSGGAGPTDGPIVDCGADIPTPPPGEICAVTPGVSDRLLVRGTALGYDTIYESGSVLIEDLASGNGVIVCSGCECDELPEAAGATVLDCPSGVISPGLINPIERFDYGNHGPVAHGDVRYLHRQVWREGPELVVPRDDSPAALLVAEVRHLLAGTTSANTSSQFLIAPGLVRNLNHLAERGGIPGPQVRHSTFPLGDSSDDRLDSAHCDGNVLDFSDEAAYTAEIGVGVNIRAAEELECFAGAGQLTNRAAIVHGIPFSALDVADLRAAGAPLVWTPRSDISLYGDTARVSVFRNLGVAISLGTDWAASGSEGLLRELRCADSFNETYLDGTFDDAELHRMVTFNAALSLGHESFLGSLLSGRYADLAIFDGSARDGYRAVLEADPEDVRLVLRGGVALYGDEALVDGLRADSVDCEPWNVCGVEKRICVGPEGDMMTLEGALGSGRPLFSCNGPSDEPTCTPLRVDAYDGLSTATDEDGDGVLDDVDLCSSVFDPPLPFESAQRDADEDGVGDACDPCPLDPDSDCERPTWRDFDGDGTDDDDDLCPRVFDPAQTNADGDGYGDACDVCPTGFNSSILSCPYTIYDLKRGSVAFGSDVRLVGALVTAALAGTGFYVQVHPSEGGYDGPAQSGIFVSTTTWGGVEPAPGDRVEVQGTFSSFFGSIQIGNLERLEITSSGGPLPDPIVLLASQIAAQTAEAVALEGVLVRVESVVVSDVNPPLGQGDAAPSNEFVAGGARVDDLFYLVDPFPVVGAEFSSITGILRFADENFKIEPRSSSDVSRGAPVLSSFGPDLVYLPEGLSSPTIPNLVVSLDQAATTDTVVMLDYGSPGVLTGPVSVTIPAGNQQASVALEGVSASPTPALVTATLNGVELFASVRVFAESEPRGVAELSPSELLLATGDVAYLTVTLDLPAPSGVLSVDISAPGFLAVASSVDIPAGEISATFPIEGASAGSGDVVVELGATNQSSHVTVVAPVSVGLVITELFYDAEGTDDQYEWVRLYNGTGASIDLGAYSLGWGGTSYLYGQLQLSGIIPAGGCFVVGGPTSSSQNGSPTFDLSLDFSPDLQNGSADGLADGVALFDVPTGQVTGGTVPIDAVIYGVSNDSFLLDELGAGGQVDVADAPAGSSIGWDPLTGWEVRATPTPGACP